jgi:acetate kinase
MRSVIEAAKEGNARAKLALDVFAYRIKKYIGSYLAVLGGAEAIVFTGGIGENNGMIRAAATAGLEELGVKIDAEKNAKARGEADVSAADSRVKILVVPTNEELVIARDTAEIAKKN